MSSNSRTGAPAPWLWPLLGRLHFYTGLLIGPFLLIAAISGMLYALTPQIEQALYHDQFYTDTAAGEPLTLARQVALAKEARGTNAEPLAVRPAPAPGQTTRVMFTDESLGQWEHMAVFVDPVTGGIQGQLPVYGTSGITAFRIVVSKLHRQLLLGDAGRLYSELAASWLWVAALGGLALWFRRRKGGDARKPGAGASRWHRRLGPWALIGFLLFSATGLTWSQYAGNNIGKLRAHYGWQTPSVATDLSHNAPAPGSAGIHAGHASATHAQMALDPALFDRVLAAARADGIGADKVEITPAAGPDHAWTVSEIGREWPTEVDQAAIDPHTLAIVDRTRFETFPLAAKLTRWGVDLHMGVLFGVINQWVLVVLAAALVAMTLLGYAIWWRRRPTHRHGVAPLTLWRALWRAPLAARLALIALAALIGWALPVLGVSLVLLMGIDAGVALYQRKSAPGAV